MLYNTSRFGQIEIPDNKILNFPKGIIGFENEKKFLVLKHKPESSFFWLQSLETPELAFSLLFPFDFIPLYVPGISSEDLKIIEAKDQTELEIYCMVVIPKDPSKLTINLLSPVVINTKNNKGIQSVLLDSQYEVNHRLIPDSESSSKEAV
ncbi:MAG: hypothetical protein ACD_79C00963G0006 [uncultured bacterium]|nr:MAG: hypothetical protein ACD_79C00963G0006 [uncultured bacterium]